MTDIVERLESHMGLADIQKVLADCREAATEIVRLRSLATQHHQGVAVDVDALAQEIRRVDGNHSLGAGALAEALLPFLTAALAQQPLSVQVTDDMVEAGCIERYQRWSLLPEDEKNNARLKMRRWVGAALDAKERKG